MQASPRLTYQPALDGLRAVAVGLVMLEHAVAFFGPPATKGFFSGGFIGVDIFFVLSGFLITALLLQEARQGSEIRLGRFYLRRALRLFPALCAVLIVMSAYNLTVGDQTVGQVLRSAGSIGLYFVNWVKTFSADVSPGLGHTWSLAVEEQFYLVWPLIVLAGVRRGWQHRTWVIGLVGGIAVSAVVKAVLWVRSGDWEDVYYRTDARADALLVGALLAVLWSRGVSLRPVRPLLLPAAAVLLAIGTGAAQLDASSDFLYFGGMTVVAVAAAIVIAAVIDKPGARRDVVTTVLTLPLLAHLGRISYGLYLWHVPIYSMILFNLHLPAPVMVLIAASASWLAAEISMAVIERPFLRLKERASPPPEQSSHHADRERIAP